MSSGLGLGLIPFPPGYTASARGRREKPTRTGGSGQSGSGSSPRGLLAFQRGGYVPLLGVERKRIGRAAGASFLSHVMGVALILFGIGSAPIEETFEPERPNYDIVWIPQAGLGGGGGGGGNESLEMPRQVEVAGEDALDIPVEVPDAVVEDPTPPDSEPEPLLAQNIQLSAMPMAAAQQTRAGLLQGVMSRASNSAGSGTNEGAGTGDGGGIGSGDGDGLGPGEGGGTGGGVYRPGNGVEAPRLLREVTPRYTAEAMRAKVQGVVLVEAVVLPDGSVGRVTVVRSLDRNFGLDEEAIRAAKEWRFLPGTRFGEPVAVAVTIELSFTLR